MKKYTLLLTMVLCFITFNSKANSANCPDSVRYNSSTGQFTFYYSGGIPEKGGKTEYTYLGLDITSGKGAVATHYVKVLAYNANTLVTDNDNNTLDQTSAILYSDNSNNHSREIEYLDNKKDEVGLVHCYYNAALPVKLLSFSYDGISFKWATASEINNLGFHLQYSENGRDWITESFTFTKALFGQSTTTINYEFALTTKKPYWRLVQEDINGKTETFNVIFNHFNDSAAWDTVYEDVFMPNVVVVLKNGRWHKEFRY